MPLWSAALNEELLKKSGAVLLQPLPPLVASYEPTTSFLKDYTAYVRLLGLMMHPALLPDVPGETSLIADEQKAKLEEEMRDTVAKGQKNQRKHKRAPARTAVTATPGTPVTSALATAPPIETLPDGTLAPAKGIMLNIKGFEVDSGTALAMSLALVVAQNVASVSFWKCAIKPEGARAIMDAVHANAGIKAIAFDCTSVPLSLPLQLSPESGHSLDWSTHVFGCLTRPSCKLKHLSLRANNLGDPHAKVIPPFTKT